MGRDGRAGEGGPSRGLRGSGGRVGAYLAKVLRDGGVENGVLKMTNRSGGARGPAKGKIQDAEDPTRAGARARSPGFEAIAANSGAAKASATQRTDPIVRELREPHRLRCGS